jgi:hypothetical protein
MACGRSAILAVALLLTASTAAGAEIGTEGDLASVEVHAFVSQGFIASAKNNYLTTSSTQGSFQFTEVGVNLTKQVTDKLRMGVQLFASDLGTTGNFNAQMDWFYLDYHLADWLGIRAGRVKIPFGLYNEVNDVDSGRVPILLPQAVYPIENRDYLLAQTGGELYGYVRMRAAGALEYRLYGGTIFLNSATTAGSPYQVLSLNVPYIVGGRLLWETPAEGLHVSGSVQSLRLDTVLAAGTQQASLDLPVVLAVGSVEYSAHDLLLAAEYSRWYISEETSNAALFPVSSSVSERAYVMGSYRVTPWFQPGAYYSLLFPNVQDRSGRENVQHDAALTLRYDINAHWLVKLEGHYMVGTAGLSSSLNGNVPLSALDQDWGVFLAKTTAYF